MRGMAEVQRPAEDLLVVKAGSIERNNDLIKSSMKSNMEWIKRTMDANGLVAAGPMRIISTELGRDNYTFDIAQPVRKAGAGEKPAAPTRRDKKNDKAAKRRRGQGCRRQARRSRARGRYAGSGGRCRCAAAGQDPRGAPVEYVQTKAGHAAVAYYTGFMAELDNVRNALRAWALTQGYEVTDRPYEVYKNGIDKAFTADGEYEVYWTLK